jgi:erythromycin esterase
MAWYVRQQSAPTTREYIERRDEGMAENLAFLLDTLYPNRRVIVWGHNYHLRHDNLAIPPDTARFPDVAARTMGSWIHERYGDSVFTVGLYAYQGTAADNSGEIYRIAPAQAGSLEALLHEIGAGALFLDLSRAPRAPETAWMDERITARYNGTTPLSMVLRHQYDAIVFVDSVSPRAMLQ